MRDFEILGIVAAHDKLTVSRHTLYVQIVPMTHNQSWPRVLSSQGITPGDLLTFCHTELPSSVYPLLSRPLCRQNCACLDWSLHSNLGGGPWVLPAFLSRRPQEWFGFVVEIASGRCVFVVVVVVDGSGGGFSWWCVAYL